MIRPLVALSLGTVFVAGLNTNASTQAPLQLTEIVVTPTAGEMVEFFNPTSAPVDLTNYYLTDATFAGGSVYYWQLTTGGGGGGGFADFFARFPTGATILPGEYQTVAMASGAAGFNSTYGSQPNYELVDTDPTVPDMLEATVGSINGQGGLTNSGEFCAILYWDGVSELVTDCDYVVWGDKVEAVDKTGVTVGTSTYLPDTPIANQETIAGTTGSAHSAGNSWQRVTNSEGHEASAGGNGADGSNETSENAATTWVEALATPGTAAVGAVTMIVQPEVAGAATLDILGGNPGDLVIMAFSAGASNFPFPFCPGEGMRIDLTAAVFVTVLLDGRGELHVTARVAAGAGTLHMQAFDASACRVTNAVANTY